MMQKIAALDSHDPTEKGIDTVIVQGGLTPVAEFRAPDFWRSPAVLEALKVVVVGTPKTGNTWVKHLMGALYDLPLVDLNPDFAANDWRVLGPRWVGQQHWHPSTKTVESAREHGLVFVTPVRHPADVLVSLRHHVQNGGESPGTDPSQPTWMLRDGPNVYGRHTREFVQRGFYLTLHLSICWLRAGWSRAVRYEELWTNPVEALRGLSDQVVPVGEKRLRHAICAGAFDHMQRQLDPAKKFVRRGGIGGWREVLPLEIQRLLAHEEPYPAQFAALGYSMRPDDPANAGGRERARVSSPFEAVAFDNGVPVAPVLVRAFLDLPYRLTARWVDPAETGPGTFYDWLRQPAAADPSPESRPTITELAHFLHSIRPDVRAAFPDPFGANRIGFGDWFLFCATKEYGLDRVFTLPVIRSWAEGERL